MRKVLAMLLMVTFMAVTVQTVQAATLSFKDVNSGDWFNKDLQYILADSRGIIAGYPDGTFKPSGQLTAEQFITMVIRASGYNPKAEKGEKWSKPFIDKAIELGYILPSDFYDYTAAITRGEMAKIVVKAVTVVTGEYAYRDAANVQALIQDYQMIPNGFKDAVVKVYDTGIITGYPDGTFGSDKKLTRAEGTAVMRRLIDTSARKIPNIEPSTSDFYQVNPNLPEILYTLPLRQDIFDGDFATNKWMLDKNGIDKLKEWMNIGKGYLESYYTVDYQTITPSNFQQKVQWYFMPQINWRADDGVSRTIEEHFSYWANNVKEKHIKMSMTFITDPSLVYSNGRIIVRGMAKFTVEKCDDLVWLAKYTRFGNGIEVGKTYQRVVEIELINMQVYDGWEHASRVVSNEYFVTDPVEVN